MKALLLIYAAGSYIDYLTTAWAIPRGAVEQNPLAAHLIAEHGIESLLYFVLAELAIVAVVMWVTLGISKYLSNLLEDGRYYAGLRLITFGSFWLMTLVQWLVVSRNLRIAIGL